MLNLAAKALRSGTIVAAVSEVSKSYPGIGGLISSLPLVSVLGLMWLWRDTGDAQRMATGTLVSSYPDVIDLIGTKEVLYRTREMGWGTDTHLYTSQATLVAEFPGRLAEAPRVLKRSRGNGGIGAWKVELATGADVLVQEARDRSQRIMPLATFMAERAVDLAAGGTLVDQPF
nr:hypothetical protein [Methylobacterium sp. L1A1]